MKVKIVKRYYKRSKRGRNPMTFSARQPKGEGTNVYAIVRIDPVLKRHRDLRDPMLDHKKYELEDWGKGCDKAHHHAKRREPKLTRNLTVKGFWKEIDRRKNK